MNTDDNELILARKALMTPEQRQAELELAERIEAMGLARSFEEKQAALLAAAEKDAALREYEKRLYGPYPAGNRHERRRAAKLSRQR